jgi:predicted acyltransferase
MFLMMAEVLRLCQVAAKVPGSSFWALLCRAQTHVEWLGCTLHDLIQPGFSFLVGAALPFSIASRQARGQGLARMSLHAWIRALVLVLLGVFLRSTHEDQTRWTFEDTLSQIGLGYGFLFLLGLRPRRDQWIALAAILAGYWAAFALYPLPAVGFDYARVGVSAEWLAANGLTGFAAHWQKNSNLAWAFDTWFLNLFPRESPFVANGGGYATLSFVPTLGTMVLGLLAGGVLRGERPPRGKLLWLAAAGAAGLASGWLLDATGVCPSVKRIWTPAWTLWSGGWCFLILAAFHVIIEILGVKAWAFPLIVIGTNSIAAYCMAHLFGDFIAKNLKTHLGQDFFWFAGEAHEPFFHGAAVLLTYWLILYWMYRRRLFLRI